MSIDPFGMNLYYKASDAHLGEGTKVWQFATIESGVVTGKRCVIGSCAWVGQDTVMGDDVHIQHGAFIPRRTKIGNRVFIGPNVSLTDDKYPRVANPGYMANPPILDDDCVIGAGAVICPGVHLWEGSMVAAGAVVTHDVPAFTRVAGVPARPTGAASLGHNLTGELA